MSHPRIPKEAKERIRELEGFFQEGLITEQERDSELRRVTRRYELSASKINDIRRAAEHKLQKVK
jgi:hypothetical protein